MDNRRSPCPPGQHQHQGIIGCHLITQRHRSLGGSTGDPRLDTKMDITPDMGNKKTDPSKLLTDDKELYDDLRGGIEKIEDIFKWLGRDGTRTGISEETATEMISHINTTYESIGYISDMVDGAFNRTDSLGHNTNAQIPFQYITVAREMLVKAADSIRQWMDEPARSYTYGPFAEEYVNAARNLVEMFFRDDGEPPKARGIKDVDAFVDEVNRAAVKPIDVDFVKSRFQHGYLKRNVEKYADEEIWDNLSTDLESVVHFDIDPRCPTMGVFMVDTDFLVRNHGNPPDMEIKRKILEDRFKKGIKLNAPIWWARDGDLGEGNHRLDLMRRMGFKSVPVHIRWE